MTASKFTTTATTRATKRTRTNVRTILIGIVVGDCSLMRVRSICEDVELEERGCGATGDARLQGNRVKLMDAEAAGTCL